MNDATTQLASTEAAFAEEQLHSPHYLKAVTEVGDKQNIYATRDIYSSSGVKLFGAGGFVNSSIYDRLMHHKLIPKLDECLTAEKLLDIQTIRDEATMLMGLDASLLRMRAAMEDENKLDAILAQISLKPGCAFKLTVMRAQRKELFQRSIYVTLVTIYLGLQCGLNDTQLVQLATAALLHDIGLLHVDPKLLELSYHMTQAERRHLYAHPLTAWMILNEDPDYGDDVAQAVLQHHERLDGSGYPQALHDEQIGLYGQLIGLAEIVASHFGKQDASRHLMRLETMLKLNARRYGRNLIGHLKAFYAVDAKYPTLTDDDMQRIRFNLILVTDLLDRWEARRWYFPRNRMGDFINERMQALKMEAYDAGINPYTIEETLRSVENNPTGAAELRILIDEILWQLNGILHETERRWPELDDAEVQAWIEETEQLLHPPEKAA